MFQLTNGGLGRRTVCVSQVISEAQVALVIWMELCGAHSDWLVFEFGDGRIVLVIEDSEWG